MPTGLAPTVIHVTDGEFTDEDPSAVAQALKQMSTGDGECLLFNLHISSTGGQPVVFPSSDSSLDEYGRKLFRMSSAFPDHLVQIARDKGYNSVSIESSFFGYKAGYEAIVDFFDSSGTSWRWLSAGRSRRKCLPTCSHVYSILVRKLRQGRPAFNPSYSWNSQTLTATPAEQGNLL
jgi:hypothetical protein